MFGNFSYWKLRSLEDYARIAFLLALGAVVLYAYTRFLKGRRTQEHALLRVGRRLERSAGKGRVFRAGTLRMPELKACDHVIADRAGIVLLKTFGWGLKIRGYCDEPHWELSDDLEQKTIDNPLLGLNEDTAFIEGLLSEAGASRVPVRSLVILADNYGTPRILVKGTERLMPFQKLKSWLKERRRQTPADSDRIARALEFLRERQKGETASPLGPKGTD